MERYNKFLYCINKIVDILFLGILWSVCSLPLFTIGASTSAAYVCIHQCIFHDQNYITHTFFSEFRQNLKTGCLISIVFLPALVLSALAFYQTMQKNSGDFTYLFLFLSIFIWGICLLIQIHLYALTARFHYPKNILFQLVITFLSKDLFQNLLLLFLLICALDLVIYYPPSLLFVPGVYLVLCYIIEEQIFRKHIKNL